MLDLRSTKQIPVAGGSDGANWRYQPSAEKESSYSPDSQQQTEGRTMSMAPLLRNSTLSAVLVALLTSVAVAETKSATGLLAGTQEVLASIPLADGTVAKRVMFSISVMADDPTSPFHLASQDCFATYIFSANGEPLGGRGSCDGISADGYVWWIAIELRADGAVNWVNRGGTGRFAEIEASGTTSTLAEFSDGKVIARFEGTYTTP